MNTEEFGAVEGVAFPGSEIESAINTTAEAAKGAEDMTLLILNNHLNLLCKMQRESLVVCAEKPVVNLTVPQGMAGEARVNGGVINVTVRNIVAQ